MANPRETHYRWALGLIGVFLCLPPLFVRYAPLVDYPNHLARTFILYHYKDFPAYQAEYYRLAEPIPNLAIDLVVPLLLRFAGILLAGKLFLLLTVLLFVAGCHRLGQAIHKQPTWLALPCSFFVYNSMLLYGFVNYVFGVGLFCLVLAYWLDWRKGWTIMRFLLIIILVLCAFLVHLSAYSFLAATSAFVAAWDVFTGKERLVRAALSLAPLLLPVVLFILFMRGSGQAGQIEWNSLSGKLIGLMALVLSYNRTLDALLLAALVLITLATARLVKRVQVVWPTFAAGLLFVLLYLLSPKVLFTSSGADVRFVLPAALLLILSLRIELPLKAGKILLLAVLLVACVRVAFIWRTWIKLDQRIAAEVERLAVLPEEAKVYPVLVLSHNSQSAKLERPFEHILHYATINRRAFVPTLYAIKGQQPLLFRVKPHFIAPENDYAEQWQESAARWLPLLSEYDYVWAYGADAGLDQILESRCTRVYEADGFALWRVNVEAPQ
ncbi:MAG TPA: hypothetical protein VGB17_01675 [Pyrinomonadaceae bacterium]